MFCWEKKWGGGNLFNEYVLFLQAFFKKFLYKKDIV